MKKLIHLIINIFWVAIFVWAVIGLSSCSKKTADKPEVATESDIEEAEDNTEEFFEALEDHDFEKAEKLSTPETRPVLQVVIKDAKQYKKKNGDYPDIKIEIIDRKPLIQQVNFTVKIQVGKKVRKDVIKVILVEEKWLVSMPRKQIALIQFVTFYDRFEIVLVDEVKYKKHPRGHAYGHYKH